MGLHLIEVLVYSTSVLLILGHMGLHLIEVLIEVLVYSTSVLFFNTNTRTYGTTPDRSTSVFNQCVTL